MTLIALILSRQSAMYQKHKTGIVLTVSAIGFLTFVAAGAGIFMVLEGSDYEKSQRDILDAKSRILKKYPNISGEVLDEFLDEMRAAGIRGLPRKDGRVIRWRFADSFFFVVTILTTVGYGHFTPKTLPGKILCLVYTAVGIPITLVHLTNYVDRMTKLSERYKARLFRMYQDQIAAFYLRFMHAATIMSMIVLVCFIVPAACFVRIEKGWNMFDGIYYTAITMSTVGFGDMVPALDPDISYADLYKFSASFYLIVGVTIIMFMMNMCGDFFRNYRKDYEPLPFTITDEKFQINPKPLSFTVPVEKFPINPGITYTYGSILTQSGKSEADEKCLLK